MNLSGNTILITGGGSGIGLAFAERFLKAGSKVIICGRRQETLLEAKQKYPELHTRVCDVAKESERVDLFNWATSEFPDLNVLVNNAGIQRRVPFVGNTEEWSKHQQEIAINLEAPIHLAMLFIPLLDKQENAAIINVTSGLAFIPPAFAAVYGATKAALHSFTMSLRHQLSKSNIKVIEVAPPAVQTDLGGVGLHTFGEPLDEFADSVIKDIEEGKLEIGYGSSERARKASREEIDAIFAQMNNR
ncbi:SDR family oxidoreductase [Pontibacter silvestris]|uniref:SDR family oxidoreductase n=1 Tax=Pontibacter silvestris TaxID=2305183 RepID=A0ABW4X3H3_9BACT|nr:SDR family NAD(P)-dependent oxidoreductase [Pontibacter silvestris]MCC9134804.1 SDR family NAD(P)-dependent oxidoreductase [Pontibacter silvestris]